MAVTGEQRVVPVNEAPKRSPNILPALRVYDTSAPCYMALPMQGSQEDRSLGTRRQMGACPTRAGLRQELGSTLMSLCCIDGA